MTFPDIDPVALHLGPLVIRWYALAYVAGIVAGWAWAARVVRQHRDQWPQQYVRLNVDDLVTYVILGIILGGRLGYVLFYNLPYYIENPADIPAVWHGGMSFHGGAIGVMAAFAIYCWRHSLSFLRVGDVVAFSVPFGLFFGRIANFINGELYGRVTTHPWGMIFPNGGPDPRHPSQLYEAVLEGPLLLAILIMFARTSYFRRYPGMLGALFLMGYAVFRFCIEFVREPDAQLGFLWAVGTSGATMGQLLCLVMFALGAGIAIWTKIRHDRYPA